MNGARLLVLMCTHDGQAHLQSQLDSLAAQRLLPHAIHVHDWGSSDHTRSLLKAFASAHPALDVRHTWHDEVPGAAASFLRALRATMGERDDFDYLCWCDQDDVWHADKLQALAAAAREARWPDVLHADMRVVDAGGFVLAPSYFGPGCRFPRPQDPTAPGALFVNTVAGMSMAVSRAFLERCRPWWLRDGWVMHDWMVILACQALCARAVFVPRVLVDYRQHSGNLIGARPLRGGLLAALRAARVHVGRVRAQYELHARVQGREPLRGWALRRLLLRALLQERCLTPAARLRLVIGYTVFW